MSRDTAYLLFAKIFGNKYGKELMDTATKTAKTVGIALLKLRLRGLLKK